MKSPSRPGPPSMSDLRGDGATGNPGAHAVGTAGQDDRHSRSQYEACAVSVRQKTMFLGENVPGFQVRRQQNVWVAGDLGMNALCRGGLLADRVVERWWAVNNSAFDLPAIGHLAQGGGVEGGGHFGVDRLHCRENCDLGFLATE